MRRATGASAKHWPSGALRIKSSSLSCLGHNVNHKADEVLDYATPGIAEARWPFFVGGVVVAEVLSVALAGILQAGGPIFPFTVLFAPLAVIVEMNVSDRSL